MLTLVIANKTYSSWSLRPWLLMKQLGIAFDEVADPARSSGYESAQPAVLARRQSAHSRPRRCDGMGEPCDHGISCRRNRRTCLAAGRKARAMARSVAAEMHAGFSALRSVCPMNLGKKYQARDRGPRRCGPRRGALRAKSWRQARGELRGNGSFLFGGFSAADAMFAPLVTGSTPIRSRSGAGDAGLCGTVLSLPAFK